MESSLSQKIRLRFQKVGDARFLSHHDLMRLFERVVRRAGIPIRMTSGFNPHPRISFPLALGLGIEACNEIVELELCQWMAANEVRRRIADLMPEGMLVASARVIPPRAKAQVTDVTYEIEAPEGGASWQDKVRRVMAAPEIIFERSKNEKKRQVNIRPFILDISLRNDRIIIWLKVTPEGTARVEEVLQALLGEQTEVAPRRIVRSQVNIVEDEELKRRQMR